MSRYDLAWWLYFLTCIVSWYGFWLFLWWWLKQGKASAVYAYVTFLLLGIALSTSGSIYVRHFKFHDPDVWLELMGTWWWGARLWVTLISVTAIVGHMSYRAFWKRHKIDTS